MPFETPPSLKAFASSRDAPNFQANNPLFKERVPELHVAYRSRRLSPARPASVAFHGASLASDHSCSRGRRHVAPTPCANRLSSDAPSGSLPAGPHERCRRSTNRSAFRRWVGAVRPSRVSSLELGPPFRRGRDLDERERTRHRSPTSAIDVKFEHTRERPVTPRAGRELGAGVGHRRPRAAEHRLPGWESSSRSVGRPDPTRLRHEAREACSNRSGYPCRAAARSRNQGAALAHAMPRGPPSTCRANGEAVERTRVPSHRSEPRLFTAALR
jgi:hypothetical protein